MHALRGLARQQSGASLTLFVVVFPLILTILGIVVDTGLYGLSVVQLSSAADSASLAAASAVDFDYYRATGRVRLDPARAKTKAVTFAAANYGGQVETIVTIPNNNPRKVQVLLRTTYRTVFFKIFGLTEVRLEAGSDAQVG